MSQLEVVFLGNNFERLLLGLWVSVRVALISMGVSLVLGTLLGLLMTVRNRVVWFLTRTYVETLRLLPQLVLLFVVFFEAAKVTGVDIPGEAAAIIVFSAWGTAELGDLVRGAVESVPAHQRESAAALGLSPGQIQTRVVLPQAVRQLVPLTVNLTTRMIKTTPLIYFIGVTEVLAVARQVIDANRFSHPDAALWVYGVVFILYFLVCWAISLFARRLERTLAL
ncbi:ABC transporter permease subunit [Corynebacterium otitidis]